MRIVFRNKLVSFCFILFYLFLSYLSNNECFIFYLYLVYYNGGIIGFIARLFLCLLRQCIKVKYMLAIVGNMAVVRQTMVDIICVIWSRVGSCFIGNYNLFIISYQLFIALRMPRICITIISLSFILLQTTTYDI